jgi:hypothetical protein
VPTLTPEQIAALKAEKQVTELLELEAPTGEVAYFKAASPAVWKRFKVQQQDDRKREVAVDNLVRGCLVHPNVAEFDGWLERRPALLESFGVQLIEHAGLSDRVEKKVL